MPRAQCYYEILGIKETATSDEVKKAYRNLALLWHPDKNQTNAEEAHSKFQSILKAYETLSDNREREWYDRHKDQILFDGDKNDLEPCINLFQYFSSSCYSNFDDSAEGFYTVYRQVFEEIAKEEEQAVQHISRLSNKNKAKSSSKDDTLSSSYPTFGDSKSDYESVVRRFYAFWSGFCTNITFDHLDKYNTTEAENRRILRAMEKENKKVKDAARKERNLNVRNLIEFIKKRDKRLKAHKLLVEEQNKLNRQKTAEKQRQQRDKCLKDSSDYKPAAWQDLNDIEEQLRQLESQYDELEQDKRGRNRAKSDEEDIEDEEQAAEGEVDSEMEGIQNGDDSSNTLENKEEDEEEYEYEEESFYCPACKKDFRSVNAFENHEASKKHKQNVLKLTKLLKADEGKLNK